MRHAGSEPAYIHTGTSEFWRASVALVAAAFCTFALIYCVQPLMPVLAAAFQLSPAASSLALSVTTAVLAVSMLVVGLFSDALGRKRLMGCSLTISALLSIGTALAPSWHLLLVTRALAGIALSGVPAIAMAYVGEEVYPASGGLAMGLYVGGTALGGMSGRLLAGVLCDLFSWRAAIGIIGLLALVAAALFWILLPRSRHFTRRSPNLLQLTATTLSHLRDPGLRWLFLMGFLLMGSFVSVYNYIEFRLVAPPYYLTQSHVGLLFTVYVIGMFSSAWAGKLAGRYGPRAVLWSMIVVMAVGLLVTFARSLPLILVGISLVTFGFFGGHSISSGWVGRRAHQAKALASSLYLFAYYVGSSVVGTLAGICWSIQGWIGVATAVGGLLLIALVVSLRLSRLEPLKPQLAIAED